MTSHTNAETLIRNPLATLGFNFLTNLAIMAQGHVAFVTEFDGMVA